MPSVTCHREEDFDFPRGLTFLWLGFRQRTNKGLHLGRGGRGGVRSQTEGAECSSPRALGQSAAGCSVLPPDTPLHFFHQIQERLLELGCHSVSLVESGNGTALAQAWRGSLCSIAGEEVCHHLEGPRYCKPMTEAVGDGGWNRDKTIRVKSLD